MSICKTRFSAFNPFERLGLPILSHTREGHTCGAKGVRVGKAAEEEGTRKKVGAGHPGCWGPGRPSLRRARK